MKVPARIIWDVISHRVTKLEMTQFFLAVAIMLSISLPLDDILLRTLFAFLLNVLAYLNHDYLDLERDLSTERELSRTRYLSNHRTSAIFIQVMLTSCLIGFAFLYSFELLLPLILGAGLGFLYSKWLKEVPVLDIVTMGFCGVGGVLVAFPLDRMIGWLVAILIGLISAVSQALQVLRDYDEDSSASITTTAVSLGPDFARSLAATLLIASAVYGVLFIHKYIALFLLISPLTLFTVNNERYIWSLNRLIYGSVVCGMLLWIFLYQRTDGFLNIV